MLKRQVGEKPTIVQVVTQEGHIKDVACAPGRNNCIELTGRGPHLRPDWRDLGWSLLEDLYRDDSRAEVRENGMAHYKAYCEQLEARTIGSYVNKNRQQHDDRGGSGDSKERRLFVAQAFPDEWLPEEVIRRRKGESNVSRKAMVMPPKLTAEKRGKASRSQPEA